VLSDDRRTTLVYYVADSWPELVNGVFDAPGSRLQPDMKQSESTRAHPAGAPAARRRDT
jgi:hypothetical protein